MTDNDEAAMNQRLTKWRAEIRDVLTRGARLSRAYDNGGANIHPLAISGWLWAMEEKAGGVTRSKDIAYRPDQLGTLIETVLRAGWPDAFAVTENAWPLDEEPNAEDYFP
jgi:hypothetical protein